MRVTKQRMKQRNVDTYVTIRITREDKCRLNDVAFREGRTASGQVRYLIMKCIGETPKRHEV